MDWLDLLAVQGTLKSLLQHHSSKASIHPDGDRDWGQEEKGTTEDEMVEWHNRLDGHEFEQVPVVGEGQGSLACCSPWGFKELDMIE